MAVTGRVDCPAERLLPVARHLLVPFAAHQRAAAEPGRILPGLARGEQRLAFAKDIRRVIRRVDAIEALVNRIQSRDEMERRKEELEEATKSIIEAWAREIASIRCEVKGLWLVDWDSGDGYYCWRYPEASLSFYHSYEDGFQGRVPIN